MAQTLTKKRSSEASEENQFAQEAKEKQVKHAGPIDELDRGTPRGTLEGFLAATGDGDYKKAAKYLDLRNLRGRAAKEEGSDLARRFKIVLDRVLWVDPEAVSTDPAGHAQDGLPAYRDSLGRIETPEKTIDILLQHVPREDRVLIWKFSNRTVAQIPLLYEHHGYGPFEESLTKIFPDIMFLGWHAWQWAAFLVLLVVAYLVAMVLTWGVSLFVRRRGTEMSHRVVRFVKGPTRVLLWLSLGRLCVPFIGLSTTLRKAEQAGTIYTIVVAWFATRMVDLVVDWISERLTRSGQEAAPVLLSPLKTALKVVIIIAAALVWLDNVGFSVATLLAGLGVGGLAVALACQDTLKNLIGSIMIILDRPYRVGQRILVKGHDGVVEEIGLRFTRLRLLTGHQTTIPNDEMARTDIENIGRRPHIRRFTNIALPYDTPLEKVEKAVEIVERILDNHEGMDPEFPPRVYFNEFNRDSLNIMMLYWYHPADYWAFLALNQRVNKEIMEGFEEEGIKFALPSTATFLNQGDQKPLQTDITRGSQVPEPQAG
jgi:MscS family membrane protein